MIDPSIGTKETIGDKDDIVVVRKKSVMSDEPWPFLTWEAYIMFRRVLPFKAVVSTSFYEGKVRGKRLIKFHITVPTGIVVSYKGKEWAEDSNLDVMLPFVQAKKIAEGILRTLEAHKE